MEGTVNTSRHYQEDLVAEIGVRRLIGSKTDATIDGEPPQQSSITSTTVAQSVRAAKTLDWLLVYSGNNSIFHGPRRPLMILFLSFASAAAINCICICISLCLNVNKS